MTYLFRRGSSLSLAVVFIFEFGFVVNSLGGRLHLIQAQRTYGLMAAQVWYIVIKMNLLGVRIRIVS
jgi:hypothetical protein